MTIHLWNINKEEMIATRDFGHPQTRRYRLRVDDRSGFAVLSKFMSGMANLCFIEFKLRALIEACH